MLTTYGTHPTRFLHDEKNNFDASGEIPGAAFHVGSRRGLDAHDVGGLLRHLEM